MGEIKTKVGVVKKTSTQKKTETGIEANHPGTW